MNNLTILIEMQKAKKIALELQEDFEEQKPDRTDLQMDGLKPAINNLLHMYLPDDITMKESEVIAMVINQMVWNPYDFVRQEKKEANTSEASNKSIFDIPTVGDVDGFNPDLFLSRELENLKNSEDESA